MSFFHKKEQKIFYHPQEKKPVILSSICTGEETAGFQDLKTGKFEAVMLIRNEEDLKQFQKAVGTEKIERIY